jgi:ABC-type amino acid transport system permease subunit
VEAIRNVPPLVLLYFIFFALPHAGLVLDPFTSGVLGMTIYHTAFVAEVLRAGVEAVGRPQLDAARSLGLNAGQALRYVVLPQAAIVVVPPLGNLAISLTKTTSLVAIISVSDLTYQSQILVSDTFRPFELFAAAGAVYLLLSLGLGQATRAAERRLTAYRYVRA